MTRTISFSEVSMALDCQARHDFAYVGHLAGTALKPKRTAPLLSEGKAWGAGVAALHTSGHNPVAAIAASLEEDAERQREFGVHDADAHDAMQTRLKAMLSHYAATAELFPLDPILERELLVPVPARSGNRASTRYRLLAYLDGTRTEDGRTWLVEFKLRRSLSSVEQIALSRQIRWYAWAFWKASGIKPAGVETIERWNEVPKEVRILKNGKPSHAKDQLTTELRYLDACDALDVEPEEETVAALRARKWQTRTPVIFRDNELEEAGREITSAAKLIGQLDRGELMPLRNAKRFNCSHCQFREICGAPDNDLVDALFERIPAKRDRVET